MLVGDVDGQPSQGGVSAGPSAGGERAKRVGVARSFFKENSHLLLRPNPNPYVMGSSSYHCRVGHAVHTPASRIRVAAKSYWWHAPVCRLPLFKSSTRGDGGDVCAV